MGRVAKQKFLTEGDGLDWDAQHTQRYEHVAGEVSALADSDDLQITADLNRPAALRGSPSGTPSMVYMSNMKVQVEASQSFIYPDLLVTCSDADHQSRLVKREPSLIVEVRSQSTVSYERGEKFAHYRRIAPLQEYALIDLDTRRCDVHCDDLDYLWILYPGDAMELVTGANLAARNPSEWVEVALKPYIGIGRALELSVSKLKLNR